MEDIETVGLYLGVPSMIGMALFGFIDDWKERKEIKFNLYHQGKLKYEPDYEYKYFYTDSEFTYIAYILLKILFTLITIVVLGVIGIILFELFGSITIAPTTIIIILLIVIIINQNKIYNQSKK